MCFFLYLFWSNQCVLTWPWALCLTLCALPFSPLLLASLQAQALPYWLRTVLCEQRQTLAWPLLPSSPFPPQACCELWAVSGFQIVQLIHSLHSLLYHQVVYCMMALFGSSPLPMQLSPRPWVLAVCVRAGGLLLSGGGPGWVTRLWNLLWGTSTQLCHSVSGNKLC